MKPGDRVAYKPRFDWTETPPRAGTFVMGPGKHAAQESSGIPRPSFFMVLGPGFALVQFDGQSAAEVVSLDNLTMEEK